MAISFAGWLTHWIIYFRFFLANRATVKQLENNTRKTFAAENASQVLPSNIASSPKLSVKREILDSLQRWELFHVRPKTGKETKKVVVYWHGGAFIRGVSFLDFRYGWAITDVIDIAQALGCSRSCCQ